MEASVTEFRLDDLRLTTIIGIKTSGPLTPTPVPQSYLIYFTWTCIPWYARLLGFLRLPYDLVKFIATGKAAFIPWPWRW